MENKKEKVLLIILLSVIGAFLLAGLTTAFVLNYNSYCPSEVRIEDEADGAYIYVEMNNNYQMYEFKFETEEKQEITIVTRNNVVSPLELKRNGIKEGKTYNIYARYLSENAGNNSEFSNPVEWKAYFVLATPNIKYIEASNQLKWDAVDNAQTYDVYYNTKDGITILTTDKTFIDLQTIDGGERQFYVIAKSENENFRTSKKSKVVSINLIHYFKKLNIVSFDINTKNLVFEGEEDISKIIVYVGETTYERNVSGTYNEQTNKYSYSINLTTIFEDDKQIGISPANIDQFNIYNDEISYIS